MKSKDEGDGKRQREKQVDEAFGHQQLGQLRLWPEASDAVSAGRRPQIARWILKGEEKNPLQMHTTSRRIERESSVCSIRLGVAYEPNLRFCIFSSFFFTINYTFGLILFGI